MRRRSWFAYFNVLASGINYELLDSFTFDDGGAEGAAYSDAPPSGTTFRGDFSYIPRTWLDAQSGKSLRFPRNIDQGGGTAYSQFRAYWDVTNTSSYLTNNGLDSHGKFDWWVKSPNTGGMMYQTSGSGNWYTCQYWIIWNGSRAHIVGLRGASTVGLWFNSTAYGLTSTALVPTWTLDITGATSSGWHNVIVEYELGADGFFKLTWDTLTTTFTGSTLFNAGSALATSMQVLHPGGLISNNTDLNYFGGMDTLNVYKVA